MSLHDQHIAIVDRAADYADFDGLRILVPSEVYHPHEWSSTRFLLDVLPDVRDLDVLEIGGGSGALALAIKRRGARKVVATDLSEKACAAMECNALLNGREIDVRQGDMFGPVREEECFDLVIFNLPLMDKPILNRAEVALCDPDGELLTRFLRGLPEIVRPGGMALFTHASISAPLPSPSAEPLGAPGRISPVAESRRESGEIFRVCSWRHECAHWL
ncbi:methyltransferase domain-containing protein [Acidithiobacillus sulfuriphilus]|uniref:methyltransferase domain-containing protein n=1 Tax=Acidithiobacillus sulfuriphilus TaxID=1867749 RepID=UPI003F5FF6CF